MWEIPAWGLSLLLVRISSNADVGKENSQYQKWERGQYLSFYVNDYVDVGKITQNAYHIFLLLIQNQPYYCSSEIIKLILWTVTQLSELREYEYETWDKMCNNIPVIFKLAFLFEFSILMRKYITQKKKNSLLTMGAILSWK